MEFSQLLSFFIILKESFCLFPKIWKFTLPITAISIVVPSFFFFLMYSCSYQIFMDRIEQTPDSGFKYLLILMAVEILFLFVWVLISHLSSACAIIVSAVAYTGQSISPSDLLCRVRKIWRKPVKTGFSAALRLSSISIVLITILAAILIIMDLINPITVCLLAVLCTAVIIIRIKSSIVHALAYVASVVEASSEGSNAMERGEWLAKGQRLKGFMLNLFVNLVLVGCFLVFWVIVGDKGSMNLMVYGLFCVSVVAIFRICVLVAYTVFYVQCMKHRGEELDVVGEMQYAKLPASV